MRLIVAVLVGFFGFIPVYWFLSRLIDPSLAGVAAFAVGLVGLPTLVLVSWKEKTAVDAAAAHDALQTDNYMVEHAVEVEEFEDEGRHFFLALADGRTLFLTGQYLYEPCEAGAFPRSGLSVSWDKRSGYTLAVQCSGNRIPVRVHPEFALSVLKAGIPDDRHLFSESIQVVAARYGASVTQPTVQADGPAFGGPAA